MSLFTTIVLFLIVLGVALAILIQGLRNIPVGHKGVVLFLGKRTGKVFDEGWKWVLFPPFLYNIIMVDTREQTIDTPTRNIWSADTIELSVDAAVNIAVRRPDSFLNKGPSAINLGLQNMILSAIREAAQTRFVVPQNAPDFDEWEDDDPRRTPVQTAKDSLRAEIKDKLSSEIPTTGTDDWGIEVTGVSITSIDVDEAVQQAMQRQQTESLEAGGELVDIDNEIAKALAVARMKKGRGKRWKPSTDEEMKEVLNILQSNWKLANDEIAARQGLGERLLRALTETIRGRGGSS